MEDNKTQTDPHCLVCLRKRLQTGICGACQMEALFLAQIQEQIRVDAREAFGRYEDESNPN